MKKFSFILLFFLILTLPCGAKESSNTHKNSEPRKVFIYHIPDDPEPQQVEFQKEVETKQNQDIVSDDITADTTPQIKTPEEENYQSEEIIITQVEETDDAGPYVLKGYAIYNEDEDEEIITLEDDVKDFHELNIKLPAKITGQKYAALKNYENSNALSYSKLNNIEYSIAPMSKRNYRQLGGFSAGTTYNQCIDYAEFEQSTGVFSKYENKYFAISTSYAKTINSTNNNYNDNFYLSPEWKLNQYLTLRETLSTDITRNRKKAEVMLSINPFGNRDKDRFLFEIGANATYNDNNTLLKNQVKFLTKFKL